MLKNENKIYVDELNRKCIKLAEKEGLSIQVNSMNRIDGKTMIKDIKDNFNLDHWKTQKI